MAANSSRPAEPASGAVTQAVVLAAGAGSRLEPITRHLPKPLMPFLNVPLIDHAVERAVDAGVGRIAINLHHHAERLAAHIEQVLGPRYPEVSFHLSMERELLGTGGALARLRPWLGRQTFYVVNSDAFFLADLRDLARAHSERRADATWMVTRDPAYAHLRTVVVDERGWITGVAPRPLADAHVFCGVHVVTAPLLDLLPEAPSCVVRAGYLPWIARGARVLARTTSDPWDDLGTPERYVAAHGRYLGPGAPEADALRATRPGT